LLVRTHASFFLAVLISVALLGFISTTSVTAAESAVDLSAQIVKLQDQIDTLKAENDALRRENQSLRKAGRHPPGDKRTRQLNLSLQRPAG
jgi:cell division protein FtsB